MPPPARSEPPASQCPFNRLPVKASGVPGTGRLPSASGPPRAVWPAERRRLASLTTPFDPRLSSWARSPWAPPAETDGACLDLTSLAEICNHRKARAHPANNRSSRDVPFLARRCLGMPRLRAACVQNYRPGPGTKDPNHAGRSTPSQHARSGNRGRLELLRTPRSHRACREPELETPSHDRLVKTYRRALRANGTGLQARQRCFLPSRSQSSMP